MSAFKKKKIITSALPYIHGIPHLGNIAGSLLPADIYSRFLDVIGVDNISICGSDEHGTPLELAAIEAGEEPETYSDKQHEKVKSVIEEFNIDFTLYGRTHTEQNREQTHEMFKNLYKNGYIVEKTQEMAYCIDCERFLPDRYIEGECPHCGGLARGDQCDEQGCGKLLEPEEIIEPYCTICGKKDIEFRETKNLYLKLSEFEEELRNWMDEGDHVPDNVKKEVKNLINEGLEDRCITRDISWGFDVPTEGLEGLDSETYKDKVLYVWFDAPIGYIGITRQYFESIGEKEKWKDYWKGGRAETIYSIGKDNTIFHTIIWPSVLLGQRDDYNLPDYEFIHQYLLSGEVQFSKSRGTGLDGKTAIEMLPADYWRYYLSKTLPVGHDSKFSWKDLDAKINNELNDTVGNYVNRVISLSEKWFGNRVPDKKLSTLEKDSREFLYGENSISSLIKEFIDSIENEKNLKKGIEIAVSIARKGDEFLSSKEPWNNEDIREDVIFACVQALKPLAAALYPYIPESSSRIWDMVGCEARIEDGSDHLNDFLEKENLLEPGKMLGEKEILFEKIDVEDLKKELDGKNKGDNMEEISFKEFQKMDLRTATIRKVEEHPNADKLYILKLDVGGEIKQSCSGLKGQYTPEDLEGRKVVVLNNLETAELRGKKSEVMVLAAEDEDGNVSLLKTDKEMENGVKVI